VNSKALEIAGINRDTPDPPGGKIDHDADGNPNGVFHENADKLVEKFVKSPPGIDKQGEREFCDVFQTEKNEEFSLAFN
jgi:predicted amidohydrolase YtcJ